MTRDTIVDNSRRGGIEGEKFSRSWPHVFNPPLAYLGCTLGLLNIDRFSTLSIQFGANFILQFLILSFFWGIPFLILQTCLGQRINTGVFNMWKISPIFQGVGIALLLVQACIGIYSIVGISWMLVYLRDAFIAKEDTYKWTRTMFSNEYNAYSLNNSTSNQIIDSVPDYFSCVVLQRQNYTKLHLATSTFKFQVGFNLAVVWIMIFISLSKGLQSYGRVIYFYTLIPILANIVFCAKILLLTPQGSFRENLSGIGLHDFFKDEKSWIAAASEAFFTWCLLGAAAMQIAAQNKDKHLLRRDTAFVIVTTLLVLLVNALIANSCMKILGNQGYLYQASSFEEVSRQKFLRDGEQRTSGIIKTKIISHSSFLIGQRIIRSDNYSRNMSSYEVLRFSTELVPSTIASLSTEQITPFWTILFYLTLTLFGISQQLAIWHCFTMGILSIVQKKKKIWDTSIRFITCLCAYSSGLPMASEMGIHVIHYVDYVFGSSWWIMILYLIQLLAVSAVSGRPYNGEAIVTELFPSTEKFPIFLAASLLSFTWKILIPIILGVLSVVVFKSDGVPALYLNHKMDNYYWTYWENQSGNTIQLVPILIIPGVAIIQIYRYLFRGSSDNLKRLQSLCRPSLEFSQPQNSQEDTENISSRRGNEVFCSTAGLISKDLPPEYTPPPSYATATGAKIAKLLRRSFRTSVRRIGTVFHGNNIWKSGSILPSSLTEYKP